KLAPHQTLIELLIKQEKKFDALIYAERAKARVLFDILRQGRAQIAKALTKEEADEERRLNRQIVSLNNQLRDEQAKPAREASAIERITEQLDAARMKYSTYENLLSASHPELRSQRGETPNLTIGRLKELDSDPGTVYVEYVVTKETVYSFVLERREG